MFKAVYNENIMKTKCINMKTKLFIITVIAFAMNNIFAYASVPLCDKVSLNSWCDLEIVKTDRTRTKEDIAKMALKMPHSGFNKSYKTHYEVEPSLTAPYSAGSLDKDDINDALNAVKMVRYIAGLPYENIHFTDELNNIAQHGAVLLAASKQFTHFPEQPDDMSDEFFELGEQGCSEANIYSGLGNISSAVIGFVADGGENNIEHAGHRRWVLKPGAENFGIGYAKNPNAPYTYRINMHVFDGLFYGECESDSYIAWPNSGDFPLQYFAASEDISDTIEYPWSVNLGAQYSLPDKESTVLVLTRKSDNKQWVFDKDTPNLGEEELSDTKLHFSVDNDGYGMVKAILFRPDLKTLGTIKDGECFNVSITGIKDSNGESATLTYDINFFDLEKETEKINTCLLSADGDDVVLSNYTKSKVSGKIYFAEYEESSGELLNVTAEDVSLASNKEKAYTNPFELNDDKYVKVFLWDKNQKPLSENLICSVN